MSNSGEDLHDGFRAISKGKDHSLFEVLVSASGVFFCFYVALTNVRVVFFFKTFIELIKVTPVRPNQYAPTLTVTAAPILVRHALRPQTY